MTDIYDAAQALEQEERDRMIAQRVRFDDAAMPPSARDCKACGWPIDAARLMALPETLLCIDCAASKERGRG